LVEETGVPGENHQPVNDKSDLTNFDRNKLSLTVDTDYESYFLLCRFLLFQFILPSIQIILFCVCIGRKPYDLTVSVVNEEVSGFSQLFLDCLDTSAIHNVSVIKFVSDFRQVGGFLRVVRFPPPIKLTATI
jgi:hypothetical protein